MILTSFIIPLDQWRLTPGHYTVEFLTPGHTDHQYEQDHQGFHLESHGLGAERLDTHFSRS